ncbi:esterase-like activity of phytase family protein [Nocardioides sp. YIM 152588]|uniref:esterase-like activity of phytase family protein n=1 Tax=Nocardioides sp. YIM 152588 TaxID=3158259 RepID=UPI0032E437C5
MHRRSPRARGLAALAVAALPIGLLPLTLSDTAGAAPAGATTAFDRVATYPVFQNVPEGVDPADETVAEISAVSEDGMTVVYTDAAGKRIGFLDITDPSAPVGAGTLDLSLLGDADDEPTSVAVVGDYVLVVIDTSGGSYTAPSGRLDIVRLSDHTRVRSIDLGGQPDSIAISPDGAYAAIAMENQRDEDAGDGGLPQLPAGFVQVIDVADADPAAWVAHAVALTEASGDPLPSFVAAGIDTPEDPEPEYVDINEDNLLALSLQENSGVVLIDLETRAVESVFSAGEVTLDGVDTEDDGLFDQTDSITVVREPDALHWIDETYLATANEGDWKGGSRGWTVFDSTDGSVAWDAGTSFEHLATRLGLHNEGRSDNKGAEPEGITVAEYDGTTYGFVGSERSNFVAVYDLSDPTAPELLQALPTTNGPEGLLPVPGRDLLVVSSEEDDADAGVRATVGLYLLHDLAAGEVPQFPTIESAADPAATDGAPIGWGALGALTGVPGEPGRLYTASDSAYATGRIYAVDASAKPAVIDDVITVTTDGVTAPAIDIEGLFARRQGGFWVGVEGATGEANQILRTDAAGVIQETLVLPEDVAAGLGKWGIEGVSATGRGADEQVYIVLQRALAGETAARIGRYDVASATWTWFGYELETTEVEGDWIGLSEIVAIDRDTVAVIERDKLQGDRAALKRVYTVDLPAGSPDEVTPVTKELAVDVLPAMQAFQGWTQEKLEGLGITSDGRVFAVTDNDGLDDATGETQLIELGTAKGLFADSMATSTELAAWPRTARKGERITLKVRVTPSFVASPVKITDRGKVIRKVRLEDGVATLRLKPSLGVHRYGATYVGSKTSLASSSAKVRVKVVRPKRR